nr:uncharacterized protein LOC111510464 isoform X1 [Leptinotarsa decemlineata]
MEYEGVVTHVNEAFAYIILNNQTKVHLSLLLLNNPSLSLPQVGARISFKNAHKISSTYVPCTTSELKGVPVEKFQPNAFVKFVESHRLGAQDLVTIGAVIGLLENNFQDLGPEIRETIVLSLLKILLRLFSIPTKADHVCLNKHISHLDLICINSCRHVEIQSSKYREFPHWSFGVHPKPRKHSLLFGLVILQDLYGFLMLKDSLYQVVCIFTNATPENIQSIVDSYVLIRNYKLITEIYKESDVPNLECILVDFQDVVKVFSSQKNEVSLYYFNSSAKRLKYNYSLEFQLVKKSMICIGENKRPECRLYISITKRNYTNHNEFAFLILPSDYIRITIYLKEGRSYKLSHGTVLKEPTCSELTRLYKCKIYEISNNEAYFELLDNEKDPEKLLTVEECKKFVTRSSELVSFSGVLKQKRFANKLSSRIPRRTTVYGFGTPGSNNHQLVFSCRENNTEVYLDCYLNDWENILMPLGLIPQIRLIIRNVQPQSKKYLKATALTSLEIQAYEPLIEFRTANLFGEFELDWGPKFFLGHGNKIPFSVIVWGRVLSVQILSIKMTNRCKDCRYINECPGRCVQCGKGEKQMEFLSKLHVSDEYGQSKVLVKHPGFLKAILDLQDKQFEIWMKAFEEIGEYNFDLFDEISDRHPETDRDFFKYALTAYLRNFNKSAIVSLDMKCRKLDSNPQKNGGRPLWFCLDVRRC